MVYPEVALLSGVHCKTLVDCKVDLSCKNAPKGAGFNGDDSVVTDVDAGLPQGPEIRGRDL